MTSYGRVKSLTKPNYMEMATTSIIIATNITECEEMDNGTVVTKYEYDCIVYNKDEYLTIFATSTNQVINQLYNNIETLKSLLKKIL